MKKEKFVPKPNSIFNWVLFLFSILFLAYSFGPALYTILSQSQTGAETAPLSATSPLIWTVPSSSRAAGSLVFIVIVVLVAREFFVYLIAQFVLPVKKVEDRRKARDSFSAFSSGDEGVAIFVKEGSIIESHGESKKSGGGVILVDMSSAVVLAQHEDTEAWDIFDDSEGFDNSLPRKNENQDHEKKAFAEAKGPGLVFLTKGQKIHAALDLRLQARSNSAVKALTRNGIQVIGKVSVTFGLSEEPEVIPIGHVETDKGIELCWLNVNEDKTAGSFTVKEFFELDGDDFADLNAYVRKKQGNYYSPEQAASDQAARYKFYQERVFNAAYSNARSLATGEQKALWSEVPLEIAVDLFRKELLTVPYDDLYISAGSGGNDAANAVKQSVATLKRLRESFARKMKLKGVILFQFIERINRQPFSVGETIPLNQIGKFDAVELIQHRFNSLRSIGVVIKSANFGDLRPASSEIKQKMIDNWIARWGKEIQFIEAEHALESVRIQNRNRAQIQQEMTHLLSGVFQSSHTDEALALRVFQALETATANPGINNDMSPKEIIGMLDSLHKWLLVDRKDLFSESDEFDV